MVINLAEKGRCILRPARGAEVAAKGEQGLSWFRGLGQFRKRGHQVLLRTGLWGGLTTEDRGS